MKWFFDQLTQRLCSAVSVGELARWLVETVLTQHERVAIAKLPDDTFRARHTGSMISFFDHDAFTDFSNPRYGALSTVIHELGFVSAYPSAGRHLTEAGIQLLDMGDLPGGCLAGAAQPYEHPSLAVDDE